MSPAFFPESETGKLIFRIILLLLLFGLIAWGIWLYFEYQMAQLQTEGLS